MKIHKTACFRHLCLKKHSARKNSFPENLFVPRIQIDFLNECCVIMKYQSFCEN